MAEQKEIGGVQAECQANLFNLIDDTPRDAIIIMRLLSALLLIPLPYLAFRLTRALGGGPRKAVRRRARRHYKSE